MKNCAVNFFYSSLEEHYNLYNESYIVIPYSFYQNVFKLILKTLISYKEFYGQMHD